MCFISLDASVEPEHIYTPDQYTREDQNVLQYTFSIHSPYTFTAQLWWEREREGALLEDNPLEKKLAESECIATGGCAFI